MQSLQKHKRKPSNPIFFGATKSNCFAIYSLLAIEEREFFIMLGSPCSVKLSQCKPNNLAISIMNIFQNEFVAGAYLSTLRTEIQQL